MKAQYISTPSRARKIIAAVWVAAIGLSVAPTYFVTGVKLSERVMQYQGVKRFFQV